MSPQIRLLRAFVLLISAFTAAAGCTQRHQIPLDQPRLRILGTVQDGGMPHVGCSCACCEAARRNPARQRYVSSLALILSRQNERTQIYLFDASPDLPQQLLMLRDLRPPIGRVDRNIVDGVFLTHAHIGHYLGLAWFGYEATHTSHLPVHCTPRMGAFLRENGPWSQLVRIGNIDLRERPPGETVELPFGNGHEKLTVKSLKVPHRDEYSDTVGYIFSRAATAQSAATRNPTIMFVPDTEPWRTWNPSLLEVLDREHVDVLLVDATFNSPDELPNRNVSKIGHPLMQDSMNLLEPLVKQKRLRVIFTHLNHSNPGLDANGEVARKVSARGFSIAREGDELPL